MKKGKTASATPEELEPVESEVFGAAVVDEDGNEIPITDNMIKKACNELDKQWTYPEQQGEQANKAPDGEASDAEKDQ